MIEHCERSQTLIPGFRRAACALATCAFSLFVGLQCRGVNDTIIRSNSASVQVSPDSQTISIGQVVRLSATLMGADGKSVTDLPVTWSSSAPAIAPVDSIGIVHGTSEGRAAITAASGTTKGTAAITVKAAGIGLNSSGACADTAPPGVPAAVRTLYVDATSGDDSADGRSPQSAWRTLGKANNSAQPGDLFLLTGTFTNQYIRPTVSGTAAQKIVYRNAPGAQAVLDHGQYDVILWLDGRKHIVVDGLDIRNEQYAILIRGNADNIWLRNLSVHDVGTAVQILQSSDNRIENSTISRCGDAKANAGDCIWIADGSNRNLIARNTITNAGHGTIFIGGDKAGMAPSEDNVVVSNDLANPWAANVGLIGFAKRTILECNKIRDSSSSGINYARPGLQISAEASVIRFNEIYANTSDGIEIQAYNFQGLQQNSIANRVYHNTVFGNGGAGLQLLQKDVSQVKDNVIENNIFWGNNTATNTDNSRFYNGSYQQIWVDLYNATTVWSPGSLNGNVFRNNILGKNPTESGKGWLIVVRTPARGDNVYYTLQQAQSLFAGISSNMQSDPLFVNSLAHDFRLQPNSPAIDAGLPITAVKYRGNAPDLGAYELR
jgi:hypothetical protein